MSFKNLKEVKDYALERLNTDFDVHGRTINLVEDEGYTLKFNNAKRALGLCSTYRKVIKLSRPVIKANLDRRETIEDVINHELAHALEGVIYGKSGHGPRWRMMCRITGANPSRTCQDPDLKMPKGKYTLVCPSCGKKSEFYRKPTRGRSCGDCSQVYNPDYQMEVIQNY